MVTFSFGEAQAPFSNLIMDKSDDDNDYRVTVALWSDTVFTTWAENLTEDSLPFELHLAQLYSDYTVALTTEYKVVDGQSA